ncbi:AAA family ATPase [Oscillospiraceae bacterium WX1]
MKSLCIFNHKGGVGKTTLTYNLGHILADKSKKVLLVDADAQCNLTSMCLNKEHLEKVYAHDTKTIYKALEGVITGSGDINVAINPIEISENLYLLPGHIGIAEYEAQLSTAWTECFAGYERGFRVHGAIHRLVEQLAEFDNIDYVLFDLGPNIGPLNRSLLLSCDYFALPVAPDLFSLMAIKTVSNNISKWHDEWGVVQTRLPEKLELSIQKGTPKFIGYIPQRFNISRGNPTQAFNYWNLQFKSEIENQIIKKFPKELVVEGSDYALRSIKNYHSLVPAAQRYSKPIYKLETPEINIGHMGKVRSCKEDFIALSDMIEIRTTA